MVSLLRSLAMPEAVRLILPMQTSLPAARVMRWPCMAVVDVLSSRLCYVAVEEHHGGCADRAAHGGHCQRDVSRHRGAGQPSAHVARTCPGSAAVTRGRKEWCALSRAAWDSHA